MSGTIHSGTARLEPLDTHCTKIVLALEYEPEEFLERLEILLEFPLSRSKAISKDFAALSKSGAEKLAADGAKFSKARLLSRFDSCRGNRRERPQSQTKAVPGDEKP